MNKIYIKVKPQTDLLIEKFYQNIGAGLAKLMRFFPVTPNGVTLLKIPVGFCIFAFLISNLFINASLAIILWKILDKLDGALARQTKKMSAFGAWLDLLIDRFVWGISLFGIAIAAAKINQNTFPLILLALVFFLNIIFQNLTFLNTDQNTNWASKKTTLKSIFNALKIPFAYELIFSFYYLFDQFIVAALFMQKPLLNAFNINAIFILLLLYSLFFAVACLYVIISQYLTLKNQKGDK